MGNIYLQLAVTFCICLFVCESANSTERIRSGRVRDPNVLNLLQQMQGHLSSLDLESQRHTSSLVEVLRATTRLEAQRQEFIGVLDRSETHLSQRMEDVKGDARKILTLQEIIREDIDKIEQNHLLLKTWMQEQFHNINTAQISTSTKLDVDRESTATSTDIRTNLQVLQSTLQGLRRMSDTLQSSIDTVKANLTDLSNLTRSISNYEKEFLVTRNYLQSSLLSVSTEKIDPILMMGCSNNQETKEELPRDCHEVQRDIQNVTGVYRIRPYGSRGPIFVFCDMETEGGGWTVFQRRRDGSVDFLRDWQDYKYGFGNVGGEFWLGNENLYLITHQDHYELRIDLEDFEDGRAFTKYGGFAVGSEKEKFMLKLLGPITEGSAGDGMTYHASLPFSTIDADHDRWDGGHCAKDHTGGWWYNQCDASNLNGRYLNGLNPSEYQGVYWHEWHGPSYSLMATKMMVRPSGRKSLAANPVDAAVSVSSTTKANSLTSTAKPIEIMTPISIDF